VILGTQKVKPDVVKMMGNLVELKQRTNHIVNIINEIRKDQDRKIIILSKYVNHLKEMKECVDLKIQQDIIDGKLQEDEIKTTLYIGAMKQWQREEAEEEGDIFFATNDLAREGLDIERLNTVILATSQKDVNQSVGRAMRKLLENGDHRPLIIDFSDMLSSFKNHSRIRKTFYKQCKYAIEEYDIDDEVIKSEDNIIKLEDIIKTQPVEFIIEGDNKDKLKDKLKYNNSDKDSDKDSCEEIDDKPAKKPKKIDNKINLKKRLI